MTPYTKFLENEEIFLRAPEPEDLEVMYDLENDSSLWSVGCTNAPYSHHHLRQYIENVTGDIFTDKQLRFMIERRTGHQVIGCIDLTAFDPLNARAEVGIAIRAQYRKQGYGRMALDLLCRYAFHFLHLHQLIAIIPYGNEASIRLFQRQGFVVSHTLKDWLCSPDGAFTDAVMTQCIMGK